MTFELIFSTTTFMMTPPGFALLYLAIKEKTFFNGDREQSSLFIPRYTFNGIAAIILICCSCLTYSLYQNNFTEHDMKIYIGAIITGILAAIAFNILERKLGTKKILA